jgi:hypothetical protein
MEHGPGTFVGIFIGVLLLVFIIIILVLLVPTFNYMRSESSKNKIFRAQYEEHNVEERFQALTELYALLMSAENIGEYVVCDWGTLLGYVRDGDLIAHDYDIDMWCLSTDLPIVKKTIEDRLSNCTLQEKERYSLRVTNPNKWLGGYDQLTIIDTETGVHADIDTMVITDNGKMLARGYYPRILNKVEVSIPKDHRKVDIESMLPTTNGMLRGQKVQIPRKPVEAIERYYGKTWKTPKPYVDL